MIHYHVWFDLKPEVHEAEGLHVVARFLRKLCKLDEAVNFQLLKNKGSAPRTKLPRYHALIQFADDVQLGNAMKNQAASGIHSGPHGEIINIVTDFHVEVFTLIEDLRVNSSIVQ